MLEPSNNTLAKVYGFPTRDLDHRDLLAVIARRSFKVHENGRIEDVSSKVEIDLVDTFHGKDGISSIRRPSMLFASKPGTDVVLVGHAHPPRGGAVTQIDVRLKVGSIDKVVRAYGLRVWKSGAFGGVAPGPALPIREPVPLMYELAWGGQDLTDPERPLGEPRNYVGRGVARNVKVLIDQPAAQLEYPSNQIGTSKNIPAAFSPIHRHWQPRASFAGTYDETWIETRMPLLPRDFDDRFHVCVPEDQWSPTPLRGDEPIEVTNATPDGRLAFQLPRFSPGFSSVVQGQERSHRTHLDTIFIDTDSRVVELTWRAAVPLPRKYELVERVNVLEKQRV